MGFELTVCAYFLLALHTSDENSIIAFLPFCLPFYALLPLILIYSSRVLSGVCVLFLD